MRIPFVTSIGGNALKSITDHAVKIKECTWFFQQAFECFVANCDTLEENRQGIIKLKNEATLLMENALTHFHGKILAQNKTGIIQYIISQQSVIDAVVETIDWATYYPGNTIHESLHKEFFLLSDAVIEPVEELKILSENAGKYLAKPSDKLKSKILANISEIGKLSYDASNIKYKLNKRIFSMAGATGSELNATGLMHLIKLNDITAQISGNAAKTALTMNMLL